MVKYHLKLTGYVGGSDFNRRNVTDVLNREEKNEVKVLIDSTGGQLTTALSIAAEFKAHGAVNVHLSGMNASAATVASLGASTITMDRFGLYLIHKCSDFVLAWDTMNADQLQTYIDELTKNKQNLDKIDESIAAMYASRCKKKPEDLLALMKQEKWLTAAEALEWGFIDKITDYEDDEKSTVTNSLISDLQNGGVSTNGIKAVEPEDKGHNSLQRIMENISKFFTAKPATVEATTVVAEAEEPEAEEQTGEEQSTTNNEVDEVQEEATEENTTEEAEKTNNVVESGSTGSATSGLAKYFNTQNSAKTLFNSIP